MMGMFSLICVVWRPSTLHEYDEERLEVTDRAKTWTSALAKFQQVLASCVVEHWDNL